MTCPLHPLMLLLALSLRSSEARPTKWIHSFAGPWTLYAEKVTMCEEHEMDKKHAGYIEVQQRLSHWNPYRPKDLQILNGYVKIVNTTINDQDWRCAHCCAASFLQSRVTLSVRSNNQWKRNALMVNSPSGACSFTRFHFPGLYRAFSGFDPKAKGPCNIPGGTYYQRNVSVDWSAPQFPVLPYGHYRVDITGDRHGPWRTLPSMCLWAELHIVPRVD